MVTPCSPLLPGRPRVIHGLIVFSGVPCVHKCFPERIGPCGAQSKEANSQPACPSQGAPRPRDEPPAGGVSHRVPGQWRPFLEP